MEVEVESQRPWDALPSIALVNIFQRISFTDRTRHTPLVCSSWADASRDPHCWTSMVPDSTVEYAFIKDSKPYTDVSAQVYDRDPYDHGVGLLRLESLIQRADGGGGITSLFLFLNAMSTFVALAASPNDDDILRFIAQHCPNLKCLSLYGIKYATEEAILEVIRSCKKLELVDFADSSHFSPSILEEMGKCCPHIRGIRRNVRRDGGIERSALSVLTTSFRGRLKLLNLSGTPLLKEDLLTVVSGCPGLQYLDIIGCRKFKSDLRIIQRASAQIAEFFYDRDLGGYWGLMYDSQEDDSSEDSSDDVDVTAIAVTNDDDDDHIVDEEEEVMDDDVSDDDHIANEDDDGDVTIEEEEDDDEE